MTRAASLASFQPTTPAKPAGRLTVSPPDLRGARCSRPDVDPELFSPDIGMARLDQLRADTLAQVEKAKAVCKYCPVKTPCATWAVQAGLKDGIYGGMTPLQRRRWKERHR